MTTNNNNIHKNDISTSKERGCALTCVQIQNLHISTLTCQGQKYVNLGLCWVWVCIHMWFGGGLWQTCGLVRQAGILLQPLPTFVAAPMPHQPAMLIFVVHQFMRRAGPFWMQSCQNISTDVISDQIISVIIPRTCYTQVILTPFNIWSLRSSFVFANQIPSILMQENFSIKAKSFGLCQPHMRVHWICIRLEIFNCGWNLHSVELPWHTWCQVLLPTHCVLGEIPLLSHIWVVSKTDFSLEFSLHE